MKTLVSCLNAKAIPIRKYLSLNLAVFQNCTDVQVLYGQSKKNLQERKLEKHQLSHPTSLQMRFTEKYK